jgi:hypothetical protein
MPQLHPSASVSIRQHTSGCVSIREHTAACVSIRQHTSAYVSIRQHTSAYGSIRPHTSAYVRIRQHTPAYVSIRRMSSSQPPSCRSSAPSALPRRVSICTFVLLKQVGKVSTNLRAECAPPRAAAAPSAVYHAAGASVFVLLYSYRRSGACGLSRGRRCFDSMCSFFCTSKASKQKASKVTAPRAGYHAAGNAACRFVSICLFFYE